MKKYLSILGFLCLLVCAHHAHAATCVNIPAGQTSSQIQSAVAGCASGSTVIFAAGTYSISSQMNWPCGVTYTGPVVAGIINPTNPPTASFVPTSGFINTNPQILFSNCSSFTVQYIKFANTLAIKHQMSPGTWCSNGCYVEHNWFSALLAHLPNGTNYTNSCDSGSNATGNCGSYNDPAMIWTNTSGQSCTTGCNILTNTYIMYNYFGDSGSCSSPNDVMDWMTNSNGGNDYGGNCAGILFWTSMNGVYVEYNQFFHIEEGLHIQCGPNGGNDCVSGAFTFQNFIFDYNDLSEIHRFGAEMQLQGAALNHWDHNSYHDPWQPWAWTFGVSNACCGGSQTGASLSIAPTMSNIDNILAANTTTPDSYIGMADETAGLGGQYNYNLVEGNWANGFEYDWIPASSGGSISNTYFCGQIGNNSNRISLENSGDGAPPTQTNNTAVGTCAAQTSQTPTISPASQQFSGSLTWTVNQASSNRDFNAWCTTDGSTPVPGSHGGFYKAGTGGIITSNTTVNCVGMWGEVNQIGNNGTAWPSTYGWAPSTMVSAVYTGNGPPPAAAPTMNPSAETYSNTVNVAVNEATPAATVYCTTTAGTVGTAPTTSSAVYSSPIALSGQTYTVECMAVASGYTNSAITSNTYTFTAPPTLSDCYQNDVSPYINNNGAYVNTLTTPGTIQMAVICDYTTGTSPQVCSPGVDGNNSMAVGSTWASSNTSIFTVSNTGLVTATYSGTGTAQANVIVYASQNGGAQQQCGQWTFTVTGSGSSSGQAATPTFTPASQPFTSPINVTILDNTAGATIYYTTNGTTPTTLSAVYSGPVPISTTAQMEAIAVAPGYTQSAVGTATYTLSTAGTCPISAGSSQNSIQSVLTGCSSGSTAVFAAGTYGPVSGTINIPCGVSLTGPVVPYSQTPNQQATINGTTGNTGWGFAYGSNGCSTPVSISYLAWNGQQSADSYTSGGNANGSSFGGGGGFINVAAGTSNVTISNNWLHGVGAPGLDDCNNNACNQAQSSGLIELAGNPNSAVTNNIQILYNIFGSTSFADCQWAMNDTNQNGPNSPSGNGGYENKNGGSCNATNVSANGTNIIFEYNIVHWLEEGFKQQESNTGGAYNSGQGGSGMCNPTIVNYNDFSEISRIMLETQCNIGSPQQPTNMTIDYNSWHDRQGGQQYFDISAANGCKYGYPNNDTYCVTHTDYNVYIGNATVLAGTSQATEADVGIEVWGGGGTTANYNLIEGNSHFAFGIDYAQSGNFQFNNNTFAMANGNLGNTTCTNTNNGWWNNEDSPPKTPSCSGNTFTTTVGTYASVTPVISPSSGTFSGPHTVTFTNGAGAVNRDANTNIWYTTDGSTPTPGGSTSTFIQAGGSITTSATTVKAVGMWGQINQPYSYAGGTMGYRASPVVTATYTAGSVTATPVLSPATEPFAAPLTVTVTDSTSGSTIHCTTDGTTPTTGSPTYSTPFTVNATETIQCMATSTGASNSTVGSGTYTQLVVAPVVLNPTSQTFLTSVQVSATTATSGATIYCTTNNTTPTTSSTPYTGTFTFTANTPLACMAAKSGYISTGVTSATYALGVPTVATPVFTPPTPAAFSNSQSVTVTDSTSGATIYCTLDGSTPTTSSAVYSGAFTFTGSTVLSCMAAENGYNNSSVLSGTYALNTGLVSYGTQQTPSTVNAGSANYYAANLITVTNPLNVTGGEIYLGSGGTVGDKVDFIIVPSTGYNTEATTPSCYSTFTETTGTINAWTLLSFSGCTLPSGNYWIGYSTNDSGLGIGSYNCGGACLTGSANAASPNYALWYVAHNYGTYTGFPATFAGQATVQQSVYIQGTVVPTLTSITVACTQTSFTVGQTNSCTAQCNYANSTQDFCTSQDPSGNTASFLSSTPGVGTITATGGSFNAVSAGTTNVSASVGSVTSNSIQMLVTAAGTFGHPVGHKTPWVR